VSKAMDVLEQLAAEDLDCKPSLKDVVGCLMAAFSGSPGFARAIKLEFDAAPKGSTVRTKILTTLLDLLKISEEPEDQYDSEDYAAMEAQMLGGGNGDV